MMRLAVYVLILSATYAVISLCSQDTASALTILFVAAIVVPAGRHEIAKLRRGPLS